MACSFHAHVWGQSSDMCSLLFSASRSTRSDYMRPAPVLQPERGMYLCIPHPYPIIVCHPRPSSTPFTFFVPRTHIRRNALLTLLRAIATEQIAAVSPVSCKPQPPPASSTRRALRVFRIHIQTCEHICGTPPVCVKRYVRQNVVLRQCRSDWPALLCSTRRASQ